jgi:hypothetical protein
MTDDAVSFLTAFISNLPTTTQYCLIASLAFLVLSARKESKDFLVLSGCAAGYGLMPILGWFY